VNSRIRKKPIRVHRTKATVSDGSGSQPAMTSDSYLGELAGFRALHRFGYVAWSGS
jgi:hypothetical protein